MTSRGDASEVREHLRAGLRARLEPAGWEMLRTDNEHLRLVAFGHPLDREFAATCEVGRRAAFPDRPPVCITSVMVGVSYEPLRRLSPLLDLYGIDVLHERAWPSAGSGRDAIDASLKVAADEDIDHAADLLAAVIIKRAVPYAEQHADLEGLLTRFSRIDSNHGRVKCAGLLAAAGRFDEARVTLAQLRGSEVGELSRTPRRAAWQLARWMDSGGSPSLIPDSAPPDRFEPEPYRTAAERKAQIRAERAALDEARRTAKGQAREQARRTIRQALTEHGARPQSPIWIESQLDHLWDSREDRIVHGVKSIKSLARFGVGVVKAIHERQLPNIQPPGWLEPPAHALYASSRSGNWSAVQLDQDVHSFLDRVADAVPHPFGLFLLTAWLGAVEVSDGDGDRLSVFLGEQRVGTIAAAEAAAYARVLTDAAARDEHPCFEAHLATRSGGHVLQIAQPPQDE